MSTNFLSNINWSSPTTIGIGIAVVITSLVISDMGLARKKTPFDNM